MFGHEITIAVAVSLEAPTARGRTLAAALRAALHVIRVPSAAVPRAAAARVARTPPRLALQAGVVIPAAVCDRETLRGPSERHINTPIPDCTRTRGSVRPRYLNTHGHESGRRSDDHETKLHADVRHLGIK